MLCTLTSHVHPWNASVTDEHHTFGTSASLLDRVRDSDTDAWQMLVTIYSPLVFHWAVRESNLSAEDAGDIVQLVFVSVSGGLADFRNDGPGSSFRGWLRVITRNRIRDFVRKRKRDATPVGGSAFQQKLQELPATDDDETPESERVMVLHELLRAIRKDFTEKTWAMFERSALQEHATSDIASDLGVSDFAVRQACYRVRRRVRKELAGLFELDDADLSSS